MIKFSVTIPSYKGLYLEEAIKSVLKQSFQNFELIIVDDCSPDDLKSIVDRFDDTRIKYYRNDNNCGAINVVDNWNICLGYCTGEYVLCMGDDDRLLPCCLEEFSKLIEKHPNLNVFHAWTQIIDENGSVLDVLEPRPQWESAYALNYYRWSGRRQYIGDFCYRTQHLRDNDGYYKLPLAWGSDDITAVRAAAIGGIANTQRPCFEYRVNRYTISNNPSLIEMKLKALNYERNWYDIVFLKNTIDLSPMDHWYYQRLLKIEDVSYQRKAVREILNGGNYNIFRIIQWLFLCNKYGIKKAEYIKQVLLLVYIKVRSLMSTK